MVFGIASELEFSRRSSRSMVSILDSLHRFSSQLIKNGSAAIVNSLRSIQV